MTNHDNNKDLDKYLSGDSELSALYHSKNNDSNLPNDTQPSLDLDNVILAAAKREVDAKPQKRTKKYPPFTNNYLIPLSTAASLVIVVLVLSLFPHQQAIEFEEIASSSAVVPADSDSNSNPVASISPQSVKPSNWSSGEWQLGARQDQQKKARAKSNSNELSTSRTEMKMSDDAGIDIIKENKIKKENIKTDESNKNKSLITKSAIQKSSEAKNIPVKRNQLVLQQTDLIAEQIILPTTIVDSSRQEITIKPSARKLTKKDQPAPLLEQFNDSAMSTMSDSEPELQTLEAADNDQNTELQASSEELITSESNLVESSIVDSGLSLTSANIEIIEDLEYAADILDENGNLIYRDSKWNNLSSVEWRRRIVTLYRIITTNNNIDMEKLDDIVFHYNKKFPDEKIDLQVIQDID